jgi:hypothetical protein
LRAVRYAGFAAIAALVAGLASGAGPFRAFREAPAAPGNVVMPGSAERFAPYATDVPDARWSGCRLANVAVEVDLFRFDFRCPAAQALDVTLSLSDDPAERYEIVAAGSVGGALRRELVERLRVVMNALFPEPPYRIVATVAGKDTFAGRMADWAGPAANRAMLLGLFALTCAFLWALATGLLGRRPGLARADWPVLAALLAALAARLLLARCSNSDVTLYFSPPPLDWLLADKHSVVYPSFKLLAFLATGDPLGGLLSLNAVCGAATVVPLYLFVLRRTGVRLAALAAAVLFAIHPTLVRIAATDAHYSLLLLCWCAGLAVLSAEPLDARRTFAGLVLLALAATMRIEGVVYLAASAPLLGLRCLRRIAAQRVALVVGAAAIVALVGLQYAYKLPEWPTEVDAFTVGLARDKGAWWLLGRLPGMVATAAWDAPWSGPAFGVLLLAGCAAGFAERGRRWILWLAGAWLVVAVVTLRQAADMVPLLAHRAVPSFLLQAMLGGIGFAWVVGLLPKSRRPLAAALAAAGIAGWVVATGAGYVRAEYAYNVEYRLLASHLARAPSGRCRLAFVRGTNDRGLYNPETVAAGVRVIDCGREDCLAAARRGGCLYYLRGGMCYRPRDGRPAPGDPAAAVLCEPCAGFEAAVELAPVEEIVNDVREGYGDPALPTRAPLGLYRVVGMR